MGGSSEDQRRRRRLADLCGDEPEEGEFVPGDQSDADTEEYYNHHDRWSDSDETISDFAPAGDHGGESTCSAASKKNNNGGGSGGASAPAAAPVLACLFCGKEFRNHKAVCGHMKVHREQGAGKDKGAKRKAAVGGGWGGTRKRGCSGSRARAASPDQSMDVVVAEAKIVLNPMPLAFAAPSPSSVLPATATTSPSSPSSVPPMASATSNPSTAPVASVMTNDSVESSSAQPMHNVAMETVVAGETNPTTEAVVHLHAAPPPPPPPPPPAAAAVEQAPPVEQQPVAPPPGGRQDPNGYPCTKCNMWFRTHQALGGHVVGHNNRERAAALHDGAVPNRRNAKPVKTHACKVCGAEFPGGLHLGGHMRKHWTGPPFNKKPRRVVQPLPPPVPATVGVVRADEALSAPSPAVTGRVLLFGIDIAAAVKTPAVQEASSATEASPSSGGDQ